MTDNSAPLIRGAASRGFEIAFTAALPLFSALFLWQATKVPEPPRNVMVGPRTFPYIAGVLLLVISLCLLWQLTRRLAGETYAADEMVPLEDEETAIGDWPAVWVVLGSLLAVFVLLETFGFVVCISTFLFGLSTFFSPRHWLRNLVVALAFALFFYSLFAYLLGISLPKGDMFAAVMAGG